MSEASLSPRMGFPAVLGVAVMLPRRRSRRHFSPWPTILSAAVLQTLSFVAMCGLLRFARRGRGCWLGAFYSTMQIEKMRKKVMITKSAGK